MSTGLTEGAGTTLTFFLPCMTDVKWQARSISA